MMKWIRRFGVFAADRSGVAAIEFAFVAPAVVAGLLVVTDLGSMISDKTEMQSAARSGAQYFLNGGRNLDEAREIVLRAWSPRPEDGGVVTERYCMCANDVHACNTLCPDESIPESYARIRLTGSMVGLWTDSEHDTAETVRVR